MTAARVDMRAIQSERGYLVIYRRAENNRCPGCGHSAWHVGRVVAECAHCHTAIPLCSPNEPEPTEG